MKIAYNPTGGSALSKSQIDSLKNDIIFDLSGMAVYARGIPVGKVYLPFEKSTSSTTEGYNGLVPFPDYNGNSKTRFLREDGTWVVPTNTNNYRPISINGTPILENNNTVLNLVAGNNITLSPKKDSNNKYTGEVTITASNHAWSNITGKPTTLAGYGITDAVKIATKSANVSESCVGYTTADHNLQNGGLFTGLGADGLYGSQLLGNYVGTGLYYRGKNNGDWTDWKELAFKATTLAGYGITDAVKWIGEVNADSVYGASVGYNTDSAAPYKSGFINVGKGYGFLLQGRYGKHLIYRGFVPHTDSTSENPKNTFEAWKYILDENGGELKGALTLQNSQYSGIKNSEGNIILGAGNSSAFVGAVDDVTTIVGMSLRPTVLRTSENNLWHYRGDKSSKYLILDTANASSHVVDLTSNQTISGKKSFKMFYGNSSFNILNNVNSVIINYCETGGWDGGYMIKSGDKTMTTFGVHGANRKPYYAYVSLNGEVGNTNPSFKFYEGGKLTHKTLDVQESAHTNLVTNLNANMVGGYNSSVLFTCESGYGVDVNAPHRNKESGPLLYKISSNCTNIPSGCTDGVLVHFNSQGTDTAFQLVSNYVNTGLYYRSGNLHESSSWYLYNRAWKKLAFTDSNITGNAASATKLETPRTIWGLSFDGTKNVQGALSGATTITTTGNITTGNSTTTSNLSHTVENNNGKIGIYTATRRGLYDYTIGNWLIGTDGTNTRLMIGNVGIGTDSPLYKLHVAGTTSTNLLFIGGSSHPMIIGNESLLSLGAANSNSKASVVLDLNTDSFRRNSASTTISLGTATYPWANIYGDTITIKNYKNFINGNISYPNVDDSYKMGTDLGLISFIGDNGNDTGLGITWSFNTTSAHAGIYTKLSGIYGSKMYFATTNAFSHGPKAALEIDHEGNIKALRGEFKGNLTGNATTASSAAKWTTARTLTVGNSAKTVDGSANVTWGLHDILYNSSIYVGETTSWDTLTTPGVYGSSTASTFTGAGNPESANGGLTPYRYGQVIVSRAGTTGMAQFYISHSDSSGGDGASTYGIKFRTGWNNTYLSTWNTILDSSNYTSYTVKKDGTGASGTWGINITGNAGSVKGSYTANGGQQNPNYFGKNKVGFLMMNTTVNNNSSYKDWMIMDCYSGSDAGGAVAFGVNRQALGAYIMRSTSKRTSWTESAELLGTHNYSNYALALSGGTLSGDLALLNLYVNYMISASKPNGATHNPWSIHMDDYLWIQAATSNGTNVKGKIALSGKGAESLTELFLKADLTKIHNTILFNKLSVPTTSGGSTYGPGANGQVLKSNGSTVYWANDNNSYGYIGTTSVQSSSKAQSLTGIVNITTSGIIYTNTIKFTNSNADRFDAISFNDNSICIGIKSNSNITDCDFYEGGIKINSGYYNTEVSCNSFIVNSSITASGDITAYSDRRLKSNIKPLENRGYIQPMTYIKDNKECIGFIAQDVLEKYPELVNDNSEYLSLNYLQYVAVLQALIIELEKRIKELENGTRKL